jgi:NAD(P)-dependent dehydrogenase (short-subunit alcohol dehydrogenase family)
VLGNFATGEVRLMDLPLNEILDLETSHCHRRRTEPEVTLPGGRSSIVYRSSKTAVNMVMRSLAIDLAPRGITCVVINPGWVRTDMGGPNATLEASESVSAMRRVIATLGPEQSGQFFNYTGREYPW